MKQMIGNLLALKKVYECNIVTMTELIMNTNAELKKNDGKYKYNQDLHLDLSQTKDDMQELLEKMRKIMITIDGKIYDSCNHVFLEDYIDTFPEKSIKISYCTKCMLDERTP